MKKPGIVLSLVFAWMAWPVVGPAQELEPRRWTHVPIDTNFVGVAYVRTNGDVLFDPVLRIEDATVDIDSVVASYLRSFDWSGKTARFDIRVPYRKETWNGLLDGTPAKAIREGLADPRIRLSINLVGAPALKGKALQDYYARHPSNTIVGAAVAITLPLGEYQEDKLLNLGQNRFVIRPQAGVVHRHGPWSFELTGSAFLYTDNDEFLNDGIYEQEPLYVLQTHVTRSFVHGIWASVSAGAVRAGRSIVNGDKKDDRKEDFLYAVSAGVPVTRTSSITFAYARGRTHKNVGSDADNLALAYVFAF